MANYRFPNSFDTEITNPTVSVLACTDHWNGTCSVQITLATPSTSQVFMFPNLFVYAGDQPIHSEVETWANLEIVQYEV